MKPLRRREASDDVPKPQRSQTPDLLSLRTDDDRILRTQMIANHAELQAAEFFRNLCREPRGMLWEHHGILDVLFTRAKERAEEHVHAHFPLQGTESTTFRRLFHSTLLRGITELMRRYPPIQQTLERVHTYTVGLGKQFAEAYALDPGADLTDMATTFQGTLPLIFDELPSVETILYSYKRHLGATFLYSDTRTFMATYLGDLGAASDAFVSVYPQYCDDEHIFEYVDPYFERLCQLASHTRARVHALVRQGDLPLASLPKALPGTITDIYTTHKKALEAEDGSSRLVPSVDLQAIDDKAVCSILTRHFKEHASTILAFVPPVQ